MDTRPTLDVLMKLDAAGSGAFATVAGMRVGALGLDGRSSDILEWCERLAAGAVKKCALRGRGVFKDNASDSEIRRLFFLGDHAHWQMVFPDIGKIQALFQIVALEFSADKDGFVSFEMALESAGDITFIGD